MKETRLNRWNMSVLNVKRNYDLVEDKKIPFLEIFPRTSRGLVWTSVVWIFFVFLFSYIFFTLNVNINIVSGSIAGITIILGYFYTHFLEIQRKKQEEKLKEYKELIKSIRVFLLEKELSSEEQKVLINKFHDAYLSSTLLISTEAYNSLKITIEMLMEHTKNNNQTSRDNFTNAQSKFINCLRKEFGERAVEFNTYYLK